MSIERLSAIGIAHRCEGVAGFFLAISTREKSKGKDFLAGVDLEAAQQWALHAALMREWSYHALDVGEKYGVCTSEDETAWDMWPLTDTGGGF